MQAGLRSHSYDIIGNSLVAEVPLLSSEYRQLAEDRSDIHLIALFLWMSLNTTQKGLYENKSNLFLTDNMRLS